MRTHGYDQSDPRSPTHSQLADTPKQPTESYPFATHGHTEATHGVLPIRNSRIRSKRPTESYPFATHGHTEATHGVLPIRNTRTHGSDPCGHTETIHGESHPFATHGHTEATHGYDQSDPTHVCPRKRLTCSQKITHSHSSVYAPVMHSSTKQHTHVTWSYSYATGTSMKNVY